MLIKRNAMGPQSGFTLIELIVVMMILAILVATAAPKFLNFQYDARRAALDGLKAAIESAGQLTYGKSVIRRREANPTPIDIDGVMTLYGYPTASEAGIAKAVNGITTLTGVGDFDWELLDTADNGAPSVRISFHDQMTTITEFQGSCSLTYTAATSISEAKSAVNCADPT